MNNTIILRDVTKYHGTGANRMYVLRNQSLSVATGEHLGILAAGAVGKSTIARLLCGVEQPNRGEVIIRGQVSWPLGFAGGLHPFLTGEENVRILAGMHGANTDEVAAFCQLFAELGDYYFKEVHTYSSGMRARLTFALSMAMDFDAYVADEVISTGEENFRYRCEAALRGRIEGKAFVFLSRNVRSLELVCSSAAVLIDGRIIRCQNFEEAQELLMASARHE